MGLVKEVLVVGKETKFLADFSSVQVTPVSPLGSLAGETTAEMAAAQHVRPRGRPPSPLSPVVAPMGLNHLAAARVQSTPNAPMEAPVLKLPGSRDAGIFMLSLALVTGAVPREDIGAR